VLFQWADVTELLHTLGIKVEEVKSGPLKAVPSPFEPTDEKTREMTENMVDDAKAWFFDLVAKRRSIEPGSVAGLTEGRIYSGRQAVALKLVDTIGGEKAAIEWLQDERHVTKGLKVVDWKPGGNSSGILDWVTGSVARLFGATSENLAGLFDQISSSLKLDGLVSLWHPPVN
jgi:protease-4